MSKSLRNPSEAAALCVNGSDGAFNPSHYLPKDTPHRLPFQSGNLVKSYVEGKCEFHINLCADGGEQVANLVFFRVPTETGEFNASGGFPLYSEAANIHPGADERFVFTAITEFVEGPQGIIPTLVGLERSEHTDDLGRDIAATTTNYVIEVSGAISQRKISRFRANISSGREGALIENCTQGFNRFGRKVQNRIGHWINKADFMVLINAVRVRLSAEFTGVIVEEIPLCNFKIAQMFFRAR